MTTRRRLIASAAFAGVAASSTSALAQAKQADFLFVQNAASMSYADGKLVLKGVSPVTVFFSDRPDRIAGNMATHVFCRSGTMARTASPRTTRTPTCRCWRRTSSMPTSS
jgi:hypothetical protein